MSGNSYAGFSRNFEMFTNNEMLEVETLGPFSSIAPGQTVEYPESWHLFRNG